MNMFLFYFERKSTCKEIVMSRRRVASRDQFVACVLKHTFDYGANTLKQFLYTS